MKMEKPMIAKFLFSTVRVIPTVSEDSPGNVQYKDAEVNITMRKEIENNTSQFFR